MSERICPWWLGYLLASPVRRVLMGQDPFALLAPYVRSGMTVLEPGPGMGFFTLELARLVGDSGRVIAIDVQPRMLEGLRRRAAKAGLSSRIEARLAEKNSLGVSDLADQVDLVLAFAMVHEMPKGNRFFAEAAQTMKPGATLLLAEPAGHVKSPVFDAELAEAQAAGLEVTERPQIRRSHTAVFRKGAPGAQPAAIRSQHSAVRQTR